MKKLLLMIVFIIIALLTFKILSMYGQFNIKDIMPINYLLESNFKI